MGNRTDYIILDNAIYPYTHQVRWDFIEISDLLLIMTKR